MIDIKSIIFYTVFFCIHKTINITLEKMRSLVLITEMQARAFLHLFRRSVY